MNINKKLDRVKQWAGEKMGAEAKTNVSEEFKALEMEMALRHDGMEKLQKSMTVYVKSLSKRNEIEDKEKILPVAYLGQTMIHHGEDFEPESEFGNCLIGMGRTNDRIARLQETYVANATNGWLESLERSLAMMKEYQAARKKLENRRLAYDASLSKMQKAKKEDFRVEEELRSQKAKYEESSEDVLRRMEDIKEAEADSVADLGVFLESELEYYDRCRDELLRLKRDWPAATSSPPREQRRLAPRSRSNTARSYNQSLQNTYDEPPPPMPERPDRERVDESPVRPSIRAQGRVPSSSRLDTTTSRLERLNTNDRDDYYTESPTARPGLNTRTSTFQGPTAIYRESPISATASRQNSDIGTLRGQLRQTSSSRQPSTNRPMLNTREADNLFGDPSDESTLNSASPDRSYGARSVSPATSHGSSGVPNGLGNAGTNVFASNGNGQGGKGGRKTAPPPPPSRAMTGGLGAGGKKAPPPPPMKRAEISSSSVNRY